MSVQQNVTNFRQTLRDRTSQLGGVAEPVAVANGELTLTGSSSTDFDILNNIVNSFSNSPEFTGTASFVNIAVSNSFEGNSIVANTITATNVQSNKITANGAVGADSQVLMSGGVNGNLHWTTIASPVITLDATLASGSTSSRTIGIGNTTITGFANVTTTIQGGSSLTIAGAASGITTLAAGNTTITGFANVSSTFQTLSLGVGTAASGTSGEIRATNEVTAFYSSDIRLKNNIRTIDNASHKLKKIRGVMFDWNDDVIAQRGGEDNYFVRKQDTGIIAQDVEQVLPEVVVVREDGYKAVRYEKMIGLIIQAINELAEEVEEIKKKLD